MGSGRRIDPCFEPRDPAPRRADRIRVVEVLATGSNGGAQEHLYGLLTRIDPKCYDVSVVALVTIGHPAPDPGWSAITSRRTEPRRATSRVVRWERWT